MYELTCTDCLPSNTPDRSYNPLQRYLCPECGYAWTDRPADEWEHRALSFAGASLATLTGLAAIVMGWGLISILLTVGLTMGLVHATELARSALEDWLDPAEPRVTDQTPAGVQ